MDTILKDFEDKNIQINENNNILLKEKIYVGKPYINQDVDFIINNNFFTQTLTNKTVDYYLDMKKNKIIDYKHLFSSWKKYSDSSINIKYSLINHKTMIKTELFEIDLSYCIFCKRSYLEQLEDGQLHIYHRSCHNNFYSLKSPIIANICNPCIKDFYRKFYDNEIENLFYYNLMKTIFALMSDVLNAYNPGISNIKI